MEKDNLIAKGVKHAFNGQTTVFEVDSLNEHYDGLQYHDSDIITIADGESVTEYIKHSDLNFDNATAKEVKPVEEIEVTLDEKDLKPKTGFNFEEAEKQLSIGNLVSLPEWEGFWFKNIETDQLLVFTKDGEVLDTPQEEFKLREDWITIEPSPEQEESLLIYFKSLQPKIESDPNDVVKKEDVVIEPEKIVEEKPKKSTKKK